MTRHRAKAAQEKYIMERETGRGREETDRELMKKESSNGEIHQLYLSR